MWILLFAFCSYLPCHGQGTIHVTFDGPPVPSPGSAISVQQYYEAGLLFTPLGANSHFGRVGTNPVGGRPDNGTAYAQAAFTDSLGFGFVDGWHFDFLSVDLAEYSAAFTNPITVHFLGYRFDGSTVTADLVTDGVIDGTGPLADFQTFTFGPEFTGLTRVEIPTWAWSLDNLNVRIPEPSPGLILLAGGLLFGVPKFRKRAPRPQMQTASR